MATSTPSSPASTRSLNTPMADSFTPVETLVAGRSRRANAGNLLAKLLTQEADEEDTLFMEDEDDVEFRVQAKDDLSDLQLDSSSSEDENENVDEEEGEHELRAAEKEAAKQAKKRKANDMMFLKPKRAPKKVTIVEEEVESPGEGTEVTEEGAGDALTRPRKKSERISWVPEFVATRASNRTLSLKNRTQTMQRLEDAEKRRLKTIADMERAARRKHKVNPVKEMTQEERLAEAKITERRNKKSLTSWETMEKQKQEEQRQKLLDLQNRRLSGPVITYWSGTAGWDSTGKLIKIGKSLVEELEDEDSKRRRKMREKAARDRAAREAAAAEEAKRKKENAGKPPAPAPVPSQDTIVVGGVPADKPIEPIGDDSNAALQTDVPRSTTPADSPPASPRISLAKTNTPTVAEVAEESGKETNPPPEDTIMENSEAPKPKSEPPENPENPEQPKPDPDTAEPTPTNPPEPKPEEPLEISGRNLIVLANFEHNQIHDRKSLVRTLWGDQTKKQATQRRQCVITHQPARFMDPQTGMPYASLHAYKEIRRILSGEIQWSCLLGAYVGEVGGAARGVPEGF